MADRATTETTTETTADTRRDEDLAPPIWRRLGAEFVGTLLLVAVGSGAATLFASAPTERQVEARAAIERGIEEQIEQQEQLGGPVPTQEEIDQQVNDQLSVLGSGTTNSMGDLLAVALAFATILAVLVYAFGGVSGGHFNPAVTFALAVSRRFGWGQLPLYWIVQCLGGVAGAFVIAGIYGQEGASIAGVDILFGATTVAADISQWQAILAEAVVTFILMSAVMAVAVDPRAPKGWSGIVIGLALAAGILVTAGATGGSANFARSLGPFVASLVYDTGDIPWGDLVVYASGPLIGAAAAALVYESLTGLELVSPAPQPGAATPPAEPAEASLLHAHEHEHDDEVHEHEHDHSGDHAHDHDERR